MNYDFHCIRNEGASLFDDCDVVVTTDGIEIATVTIGYDDSYAVTYRVSYARSELIYAHYPALLVGKVCCWAHKQLTGEMAV